MFNGYNETPLISYEFNQERVEKKHESVPKWSYGHEAGVQPAQNQLNNRHGEFWSGKSNFLGIPNVVKCSCTGCYPSPEKQSYQGDNTTRHRPWLPRTFPVPANGSNEPCKLSGYEWDNGLSNQSSCYPHGGLPYVQENGGKYPYFKNYQTSNQPGVITSLKNAEFGKKSKGDVPPRGQESPVQNGTRQPVFCNPGYDLSKRPEGRHFCDPNEKYSNSAPYSVDQHLPRLPVVEPFIKTVPSNLSQSRVPSTGYRGVKENTAQSYVDPGFVDPRKICTESTMNGDKRTENFSTGQFQTGIHGDYSHFNRDVPEAEVQKLFFDDARHPDYYPRSNFQDVIKRNNAAVEIRNDCAMTQLSLSDQHFTIPRTAENGKPLCDVFYQKDFEKQRPENHLPENPACFPRYNEPKNENVNLQTRLPPSPLLFNDPRFPDRRQNSFPYQNNPVHYRNYLRPEYPYQGYNTQNRHDYPGFQRNNVNQFRSTGGQQPQTQEQFPPQQGSGYVYDCPPTPEKMLQFCEGKNQSAVQMVSSQPTDNSKPTYLETIRSDEVNKNGTSKMSPLRLLRRKKFVNVPQESTPATTIEAPPGLDVRKFWSTWAEEEEENVAPTQMVVLDCQNIDPEQARLLHLYETDPCRPIHLESSGVVLKNTGYKEPSNETCEERKTGEQPVENESKQENCKSETEIVQNDEPEKLEEGTSTPLSEPENKDVELDCQKMSPMSFKKGSHRRKKKAEMMDKWTEKKFHFLKRAEESKAAEILRHEEEKKKIMETRMTLQQSLNKDEKSQERYSQEMLSSFDENSQCESSEEKDTSGLPTCEYRRNKFLDYSDRQVMMNGEDKTKEEREETVESEEIKEENIKLELSENLKDENGFEMDDILKKMSDITFQCSDIKFENGLEDASWKKLKPFGKKMKKKKLDGPENDERTDKLTVETATKPTIKFSIQKSHDLKISFKVLNSSSSSKEYSDEEAGGEDAESKTSEESKKSTELITLKYKSTSDSKKSRRHKKPIPKVKRLKIKKSRYVPEEERDPLGDDEERSNPSKKQLSDECSTSDGFQVQETMDSAKIKLTFKRHKGNFETEYKINGNAAEVEPTRETSPSRSRKKSRRAKKHEIFAEAGVDTFENSRDLISDIEGGSKNEKPLLESILDEGNSSISQDSCNDEEIFEHPTFSEFPLDSQFVLPIPCDDVKSAFSEEMEKRGMEDINWKNETEKPRSEQADIDVAGAGSEEKIEFSLSRDISLEEEEKVEIFDKEIQKISLDFIADEKSQGIKLNSESAAEIKEDEETVKETVGGGENFEEEVRDFETHEGSFGSSSEKSEDDDMLIESKTNENWKEDGDVSSSLPSLDFENENCLKNSITCEGINKRKTNEDTVTSEKIYEGEENREETASDHNDKSINSDCDFSPSSGKSSSFSEGRPNDEENSLEDKSNENVNCQSPPPNVHLTQKEKIGEEILEKKSVEVCHRFESSTSFLSPRNDETPETVSPPVEECQVQMSSENGSQQEHRFYPDRNIDLTNSPVDVEEKVCSDEKQPQLALSPSNEPLASSDGGFSPTGGDETNPTVTDNLPDSELEDGEIVNSCEELEESPLEKIKNSNETRHVEKVDNLRKFIIRKIEKRRSAEPEKLESHTWSREKFTKATSCPPEVNLASLIPETPLVIRVEEIPLPLGPPQRRNCFCFINSSETQKAKEKSGKSPPEVLQVSSKEILPSDAPDSGLTNSKNLSPKAPDKKSGIFQRSSKIKFSFFKKSKFSKIVTKDSNFEMSEEKVKENTDVKKILTAHPEEPPNESFRECQSEEVPKGNEANKMEEEKIHETEEKFREGSEPFGVEDLEESVEVIDAMRDFMRDEFYECEDIPTSEDLTNGEDLEIEKVNDDKFRNIMQNCLENAKKFLNVGNLNLFSCSVDDLLGLDYQSSGLEENEPEQATNHVSRDVLLTSCEDTSDDLGLPENIQPPDISMDFVPSFCSDVCPEILPVDNWPYLEEEVPSSPSKPNETDMISHLEADNLGCEVEKPKRKRVSSETSFRRRSLIPEDETPCRKIGVQRRKTIESFNGASYGEEMNDLQNEIIRLKSETETENDFKCRLSLNKIKENGIKFGEKLRNPENGVKISKCPDYKSPSWQPKVMLFRISKSELRKVLKSSKTRSQLGFSAFPKRKNSEESETVIKKQKSDPGPAEFSLKSVEEYGEVEKEEKWVGLSGLDSIKGSLTSASVKKRRRSRFRNLHTRRKSVPECVEEVKDVHSPGQSDQPAERTAILPEIAYSEIFEEGDNNPTENEKTNSARDNDKTCKKKLYESRSEKVRSRCEEESKQEKHREKKHDHRDRRRESEGRENRHKEKHREDDGRKHGSSNSSHDRSKHQGSKHERRHSEKSKSTSGGEDRKSKCQPEVWMCEVCGFDDANERISHIKNHPFHCQSCHLAFRTEAHFITHLTKKHKNIRNQHHCLLCELSFDTEEEYQKHLETREHTHLESVEKNTINTLFSLLTGAPCPVFGLLEMKPEWLPNQAGTVHFYHQATPLSLALQYLKMHHDLASLSAPPPARSS